MTRRRFKKKLPRWARELTFKPGEFVRVVRRVGKLEHEFVGKLLRVGTTPADYGLLEKGWKVLHVEFAESQEGDIADALKLGASYTIYPPNSAHGWPHRMVDYLGGNPVFRMLDP